VDAEEDEEPTPEGTEEEAVRLDRPPLVMILAEETVVADEEGTRAGVALPVLVLVLLVLLWVVVSSDINAPVGGCW
jgi:hypothetical protein